MNQLIHIEKGDEFQFLTDMDPLDNPWAYYDLLGVSKDATSKEIKQAYRRLAPKAHPDRGGSDEDFQRLDKVKNILLDNGGNLGEEYSLRNQYDSICSLSSVFSGNLSRNDGRTQRLTEVLLEDMRNNRQVAEFDLNIDEENPGFRELKSQTESNIDRVKELTAQKGKLERKLKSQKRLDEAGISRQEARSQIREIEEEMNSVIGSVNQSAQEINSTIVSHLGISSEDKSQRRSEQDKRKNEIESFYRSFSRQPDFYQRKVLDVLYEGPGKFQFGISRKAYFGLEDFEELSEVLRLKLGSDCYFNGFNDVHFKSPKLEKLLITDSSVGGLVEVVEGDVKVKYKLAKGYNVIRANSIEGNVKSNGFVKSGDLYVPEQYAKEGWEELQPHLDIIVRSGNINLTQERKTPDNVYDF